ncbi:hypothetical protein H0H92_005564 [Tricholoma furcatifolium]|nr:hypothetical protein H0H92_005564 [Tricholoma furcatifolium]
MTIHGGEDDLNDCLEDRALHGGAAQEVFEESGNRFKPWCANGKSIRVGEIILIIDADTIVPEDCFRNAACEIGESPDVAIIQHKLDVMQVANHYFEFRQKVCKLHFKVTTTMREAIKWLQKTA